MIKMRLLNFLKHKAKDDRMWRINDLADYIISNLKVIKIDSDTHPDYIYGKVHALVDCLEYIDEKYNTNYTSKIKIDKIII